MLLVRRQRNIGRPRRRGNSVVSSLLHRHLDVDVAVAVCMPRSPDLPVKQSQIDSWPRLLSQTIQKSVRVSLIILLSHTALWPGLSAANLRISPLALSPTTQFSMSNDNVSWTEANSLVSITAKGKNWEANRLGSQYVRGLCQSRAKHGLSRDR
jgi:hypothetical protein